MGEFRDFIEKNVSEGMFDRFRRPDQAPQAPAQAQPDGVDALIGRVRNFLQRRDFQQAFMQFTNEPVTEEGLREMLNMYRRNPNMAAGSAIEQAIGRIMAHETPEEAGSRPVLWLLSNPQALGAGVAKHTGADAQTPARGFAAPMAPIPGAQNPQPIQAPARKMGVKPDWAK